MAAKRARQDKIEEMVRKHSLTSQEMLASLLKNNGIDVTQSTLSRDIRELGLVKVRGRYQLPEQSTNTPQTGNLRRAFEQYVTRTGLSGNILMVRTSPGNAHSVGVVIDAAQWPEVLGTIAGDDTIFILLRHGHLGKRILNRIKELLA